MIGQTLLENYIANVAVLKRPVVCSFLPLVWWKKKITFSVDCVRTGCLRRNRAGAATPAAGTISCHLTWLSARGGKGGTHLLHVLRDFLQPLEGRLVGCQHGEQRPEAGGDRAEVHGRGHAGRLVGWLSCAAGAAGRRGCGGGCGCVIG